MRVWEWMEVAERLSCSSSSSPAPHNQASSQRAIFNRVRPTPFLNNASCECAREISPNIEGCADGENEEVE